MNGKGSRRRPENSKAIAENWPIKKMKCIMAASKGCIVCEHKKIHDKKEDCGSFCEEVY